MTIEHRFVSKSQIPRRARQNTKHGEWVQLLRELKGRTGQAAEIAIESDADLKNVRSAISTASRQAKIPASARVSPDHTKVYITLKDGEAVREKEATS